MAGEILPDQIWREVDPRFTRFIRTLSGVNASDKVKIRTCDMTGTLIPKTRESYVRIDRFRGKRGGYTFVCDIDHNRSKGS